MIFKSVIFDLDGTLLNTIDDIADSMNHVLSVRSLPGHTSDKYKKMVGKGADHLAELALPDHLRTEKIIAECTDEFLKRYKMFCSVRTAPYSGIQELLIKLEQMKISFSILSNKEHSLTVYMTEKLFPKNSFSFILGLSDRFPAKPNPDAAVYISEQMAVNPSEILFLGDSAVDMYTAKSAGMIAAGALWGYRDEKELKTSGADIVLQHPLDVLKILLKQTNC